MVTSTDDGRPSPAEGSQGDSIGIDIHRCSTVPVTYLWRVYDHDLEIGVGVTRTRWGAYVSSRIRRAIYRWTATD